MLLMLLVIFVYSSLTLQNLRHQAKLRLEYIKIPNSYDAWTLWLDEAKGKKKRRKEPRKRGVTVPKKGLYANIHAKKKRIKAGSGEKMRKPGSKGAPTAAAFKKAAKTAKKRTKKKND